MRGSVPIGVPATSAPGGIHAMPSGVAGGFAPDAHGGGDTEGAADGSPEAALADAGRVVGFRQPAQESNARQTAALRAEARLMPRRVRLAPGVRAPSS